MLHNLQSRELKYMFEINPEGVFNIINTSSTLHLGPITNSVRPKRCTIEVILTCMNFFLILYWKILRKNAFSYTTIFYAPLVAEIRKYFRQFPKESSLIYMIPILTNKPAN